MEVVSIEHSTYEELLTSFNSFVLQMKAMAGRGTDKDEDVANEIKIVILKLMRHDSFQLVFGQELPFLAVRTDVELCERVTTWQPNSFTNPPQFAI